MDKRKQVELESAFLSFCNVADDLGFKFTYDSKIECYHSGESANIMSNRVKLDPKEFISTDPED